MNGLDPKDVRVEIYAGAIGRDGSFETRRAVPMKPGKQAEDGVHVFKGEVTPDEPGRFGYTVRVLPSHPLLLDPHSLGLIRWAER
jgi:starch phosphorylase